MLQGQQPYQLAKAQLVAIQHLTASHLRAVAGVEVLELRIGMEKVAVLEAVLAVLAA